LETFNAQIDIIGVNPFVLLPSSVLTSLFKQAKKDKGHLPVIGKIDGHDFIQTLVKYSGEWRLYINTPMLKVSHKKVGDIINLQVEYDPIERVVPFHPKLKRALQNNAEANEIFESLSPSRQKEIVRYISSLKTEASVDKNVDKAIEFLLGKSRFVGRDKP
jgi:hypothetical protein